MKKSTIYYILSSLVVVVLLYLSSKVHYTLFHILIELIPIIIALIIFVITANTMKYIENKALVYIGISYLFVAILDLFHTITYTGMPIFQNLNFPANQFWVAARLFEAVTYLIAFTFIFRKKSFNIELVFVIELIVVVLVMISILSLEIFPVCFVEGVGQTTFKIVMEYVIIFILLLTVVSLLLKKEYFTKRQLTLYLSALILTMFSELFFSLYISNYSYSNMIGHFLKLFSFVAIYMNVIHEGLNDPLEHIFKDLEEKREILSKKIILDELTQITNRRGIFEKSEEIWTKAAKEKQRLSVFMIDIDNFKQFNDFHGHIKGDDVLKTIAATLQKLVNSDKGLIGRYGGEEFIIIQQHDDFKMSQELGESCLNAIRKLKLSLNEDKWKIVTISIGLVSLTPSKSKKFNDALALADEQLYKAKNSNKDLVVGVCLD